MGVGIKKLKDIQCQCPQFRVKRESITPLRIRKEREMEESLINKGSNKEWEITKVMDIKKKKRATREGCLEFNL